jgi:hypothetical protein
VPHGGLSGLFCRLGAVFPWFRPYLCHAERRRPRKARPGCSGMARLAPFRRATCVRQMSKPTATRRADWAAFAGYLRVYMIVLTGGVSLKTGIMFFLRKEAGEVAPADLWWSARRAEAQAVRGCCRGRQDRAREGLPSSLLTL